MSCPMTVQTLLEGWCDSVPDVTITGIELDSRRVQQGHAFLAVAGANTHGVTHASQARARGASVIIHDGLAEVPESGIPAVEVAGLGDLFLPLARASIIHHPIT